MNQHKKDLLVPFLFWQGPIPYLSEKLKKNPKTLRFEEVRVDLRCAVSQSGLRINLNYCVF